MNRIFRLVFNKSLNTLVVASEFAKTGKGGSTRQKIVSGSKASGVLPLSLMGAALLFASPAWSQSLPAGAVLDIDNGSGGVSASYTTPNQFQNYSVTFTAASEGNNYLLFAFRHDPGFWTFGNASLVEQGGSTNLLADPTFTQGGDIRGRTRAGRCWMAPPPGRRTNGAPVAPTRSLRLPACPRRPTGTAWRPA